MSVVFYERAIVVCSVLVILHGDVELTVPCRAEVVDAVDGFLRTVGGDVLDISDNHSYPGVLSEVLDVLHLSRHVGVVLKHRLLVETVDGTVEHCRTVADIPFHVAGDDVWLTDERY